MDNRLSYHEIEALRGVGGVGGQVEELAGLYLSAAPRIEVIKFHSGAGVMTYRTTVDCSGALHLMA